MFQFNIEDADKDTRSLIIPSKRPAQPRSLGKTNFKFSPEFEKSLASAFPSAEVREKELASSFSVFQKNLDVDDDATPRHHICIANHFAYFVVEQLLSKRAPATKILFVDVMPTIAENIMATLPQDLLPLVFVTPAAEGDVQQSISDQWSEKSLFVSSFSQVLPLLVPPPQKSDREQQEPFARRFSHIVFNRSDQQTPLCDFMWSILQQYIVPLKAGQVDVRTTSQKIIFCGLNLSPTDVQSRFSNSAKVHVFPEFETVKLKTIVAEEVSKNIIGSDGNKGNNSAVTDIKNASFPRLLVQLAMVIGSAFKNKHQQQEEKKGDGDSPMTTATTRKGAVIIAPNISSTLFYSIRSECKLHHVYLSPNIRSLTSPSAEEHASELFIIIVQTPAMLFELEKIAKVTFIATFLVGSFTGSLLDASVCSAKALSNTNILCDFSSTTTSNEMPVKACDDTAPGGLTALLDAIARLIHYNHHAIALSALQNKHPEVLEALFNIGALTKTGTGSETLSLTPFGAALSSFPGNVNISFAEMCILGNILNVGREVGFIVACLASGFLDASDTQGNGQKRPENNSLFFQRIHSLDLKERERQKLQNNLKIFLMSTEFAAQDFGDLKASLETSVANDNVGIFTLLICYAFRRTARFINAVGPRGATDVFDNRRTFDVELSDGAKIGHIAVFMSKHASIQVLPAIFWQALLLFSPEVRFGQDADDTHHDVFSVKVSDAKTLFVRTSSTVPPLVTAARQQISESLQQENPIPPNLLSELLSELQSQKFTELVESFVLTNPTVSAINIPVKKSPSHFPRKVVAEVQATYDEVDNLYHQLGPLDDND